MSALTVSVVNYHGHLNHEIMLGFTKTGCVVYKWLMYRKCASGTCIETDVVTSVRNE